MNVLPLLQKCTHTNMSIQHPPNMLSGSSVHLALDRHYVKSSGGAAQQRGDKVWCHMNITVSWLIPWLTFAVLKSFHGLLYRSQHGIVTSGQPCHRQNDMVILSTCNVLARSFWEFLANSSCTIFHSLGILYMSYPRFEESTTP